MKDGALFDGERRVRDPDAAVAVVPGTELAAYAHWHCGAVEALDKVERVPERIPADDLGLPLLGLASKRRFTRVDNPGHDRVDPDKEMGCRKSSWHCPL